MSVDGVKEAVYLLCLATSAGCALLLFRSYSQTRVKLLFWSAICFALLAVNNMLVTIDLIVFPTIDLLPVRKLAAIFAVSVLLFGFIWESE